jgi:membrane-associated phospholipid phosphatase
MKKSLALIYFSFFVSSLLHAQVDTLVKTTDTLVQTNERFELLPVTHAPANNDVYSIKAGIDVPLTVTGVAWSLYGFSKIYNKDTSSAAQVLALNRNDINSFNRSAIDQYSQKAFDISNIFFYGAMPLPLVLMLDQKIRKDAFKVLFLYIEAMGITGILYTSAAYIHDKYRPYAYNPNAPLDRRKRGGAKNSFYAGHVALVATSVFFVAKTYAEYHPGSKIKWLLYTMAGAATATTGYLRYKAGEHFPTDIFLGVGLGTVTGILVPYFHKHKLIKNPALTLQPFAGSSNGISLVYSF